MPRSDAELLRCKAWLGAGDSFCIIAGERMAAFYQPVFTIILRDDIDIR